jgi:hypothetical protein
VDNPTNTAVITFPAEILLGSSTNKEGREIRMRAAVLTSPGKVLDRPLHVEEVSRPEPRAGQVLLRVLACGVCRTDLHIVEGELEPLQASLIPGHQIVGEIVKGASSELCLEARRLIKNHSSNHDARYNDFVG